MDPRDVRSGTLLDPRRERGRYRHACPGYGSRRCIGSLHLVPERWQDPDYWVPQPRRIDEVARQAPPAFRSWSAPGRAPHVLAAPVRPQRLRTPRYPATSIVILMLQLEPL